MQALRTWFVNLTMPPGDAYVDLVGVAVWGLEKWDREWYGEARSFAEAFSEKYRRIEQFGKPVIVAELGVAGRKRYRQNWMSEISEFSTGRHPLPLLTGIIYFQRRLAGPADTDHPIGG